MIDILTVPLLTAPSTMFAALSEGLQAFDYLVVVVYMLAVIGIGIYASRQQKGGEDYFVAGRSMPWMAVGLSMVATLLSSITYLGTPGELIEHGLGQSIGHLAAPFAYAVITFVWLPFFMRMKMTSVYEYLERRYGLVARWLGAGLFVFVLRLFWMAIIVHTSAQAVSVITYDSVIRIAGVDWIQDTWTRILIAAIGVFATLYTMLGGIKAVIWTDVLQFVALFLGAALTTVFIAYETGTGPVDWWNKLTASQSLDDQFPPLASWDLAERTTVLWTCSSVFFWYVCTFACDQVAMQRFFSTPSVGAAIRASCANFVADMAITVLLALCGMALLTYYDMFPTDILGGKTDPREVADHVFPHFIAHGLPVGISGVVVAALFAVAMSSLDSGVNSVSTVITVDFIRRRNPNISSHQEVTIARVLTLVIGLGCTALAYAIFELPKDQNIVSMTMRTFNCALGPLATMFIVGMFLPHVGQAAIVIATITGTLLTILIAWWSELFALVGIDVPSPSPFMVTPLAFMLTFSLAALLGALLPQPDYERVRSLTWRVVVFGDKGQSTD